MKTSRGFRPRCEPVEGALERTNIMHTEICVDRLPAPRPPTAHHTHLPALGSCGTKELGPRARDLGPRKSRNSGPPDTWSGARGDYYAWNNLNGDNTSEWRLRSPWWQVPVAVPTCGTRYDTWSSRTINVYPRFDRPKGSINAATGCAGSLTGNTCFLAGTYGPPVTRVRRGPSSWGPPFGVQ
ncbi:hypothetical protein EVAR_56934_1 [Eumeta japonica]|uniref:Uncharacterized protein n=1 Tax=Eumeta variegata TaxID=151549 RepID=A0A4C1YBJ2_EUMVA|nr:hypothetical protein EVAR_56934_1 [Eumeta japonica]